MFGGNLGDWDTDPIDQEINPDYKPFNSKYYPVHINTKDTFCKELKLLVEIGVLTLVQQSQCGTPVFIIPNKEGTVGFITDYIRFNQKLVRNTYPLTRIGKTMQQLEGFQYATALDLKMGYYIVRISPASQDITTIVTEFGKLRYNRLHMEMCALVDIFQSKVDELLTYLKGFKTYIGDIIVLSKDLFRKQKYQLRIIFSILRASGLKFNTPKCSFGLK